MLRERRPLALTPGELFTTIAIIGVLSALFLPTLARARALSGQAICLANVKTVALAIRMYLAEYDPAVAASVADHFSYGLGWRDCEDYALHREAAWNNGAADTSDWANPGHQY